MNNSFWRISIPLSFTCILLLAACERDKVLFDGNAEISGGWDYGDSVRFAFNVPDTSKSYDLVLELAHTSDYAWQNLYVKIGTTFPDDSIKTDILSLELSDGSGGWAGDCSSGGHCRLKIPLQNSVRFPMPGDYALTFTQHMREEKISGVTGIKLTVLDVTKHKPDPRK